jgi:hypothetical protein
MVYKVGILTFEIHNLSPSCCMPDMTSKYVFDPNLLEYPGLWCYYHPTTDPQNHVIGRRFEGLVAQLLWSNAGVSHHHHCHWPSQHIHIILFITLILFLKKNSDDVFQIGRRSRSDWIDPGLNTNVIEIASFFRPSCHLNTNLWVSSTISTSSVSTMCVAQWHNDEARADEEGKIPMRRWFNEEKINEEGSSVFYSTRRLPTRSPWSRQMKYESSSLLGASIVVILLRGNIV